MKTKKLYIEPEMKTVVLVMPAALLAGSGADASTIPTGDDWIDE